MKKMKFLAMLMASFALSLSFAACGDDDDDDNGGSSTTAVGELKVLDQKAKVKYGMAYPIVYTYHIEVRLTDQDPRSENAGNDAQTGVMIDLRGVLPDATGHIPTGIYPFEEAAGNGELEMWEPGYKRCFVLHGTINEKWGQNSYDSGYSFGAIDGCGELKVERSGDDYTLTISNLKLGVYDLVTEKTKSATTSFTYKGKLLGMPYYEEQ